MAHQEDKLRLQPLVEKNLNGAVRLSAAAATALRQQSVLFHYQRQATIDLLAMCQSMWPHLCFAAGAAGLGFAAELALEAAAASSFHLYACSDFAAEHLTSGFLSCR